MIRGEALPVPSEVTDLPAWVDLYWLPLGAGSHLVRASGLTYEAISALIQHRSRCYVYHSALRILAPGGLYVVEMTPIPNGCGRERGVVAEGAVGTKWAGRLRIFRYEIRRWCNGSIPDLEYAVASPIRVSDELDVADRILELLPSVPTPTWGRDDLGAGEMWTCNSVISWALCRAGLVTDAIPVPPRGRAPGWDAGVTVAQKAGVSLPAGPDAAPEEALGRSGGVFGP
jgi:hypothetical protein